MRALIRTTKSCYVEEVNTINACRFQGTSGLVIFPVVGDNYFIDMPLKESEELCLKMLADGYLNLNDYEALLIDEDNEDLMLLYEDNEDYDPNH